MQPAAEGWSHCRISGTVKRTNDVIYVGESKKLTNEVLFFTVPTPSYKNRYFLYYYKLYYAIVNKKQCNLLFKRSTTTFKEEENNNTTDIKGKKTMYVKHVFRYTV